MVKILGIGDIHLRPDDFETLGGYVDLLEDRLNKIIDIIKAEKIDYGILTGDTDDDGYGVNSMKMISHYNLLSRLSGAFTKGMFLCGGNHYKFKKNTNLENYIGQPSNNVKYKPTAPTIHPEKALAELVDHTMIENLFISFHHHNDKDKNYINRAFDALNRNNEFYHLGVYHDDVVFPKDVLEDLNMGNLWVSSSYLDGIYSNVDYALLGHIHTAYDIRQLDNHRRTKLMMPGSILPTSSLPAYFRNSELNLPLITVEKGSRPILSTIKVDRKLDKLEVKRALIKKTKMKPMKIDSVREFNRLKESHVETFVTKESIPKEILEVLALARGKRLDPYALAKLYNNMHRIIEEDNEEDDLCLI